MPAKPKCAKFETQISVPPPTTAFNGNKVQNKFLQNVIGGRSQDDENVTLTDTKKTKSLAPADPNEPPLSAALVNAKYVTYTRVTRDLAILMFTAADSMLRRYYLIKLVECYVETLGAALCQMGVDTDSYGIKYTHIIREFQQHILYGFLVAVLVSMSNTNIEELHHFIQSKGNEGLDLSSVDVDNSRCRRLPPFRRHILSFCCPLYCMCSLRPLPFFRLRASSATSRNFMTCAIVQTDCTARSLAPFVLLSPFLLCLSV